MHMVTAGDSASVAKHNVYIETDGLPITFRNFRGESRVGHINKVQMLQHVSPHRTLVLAMFDCHSNQLRWLELIKTGHMQWVCYIRT